MVHTLFFVSTVQSIILIKSIILLILLSRTWREREKGQGSSPWTAQRGSKGARGWRRGSRHRPWLTGCCGGDRWRRTAGAGGVGASGPRSPAAAGAGGGPRSSEGGGEERSGRRGEEP